MLAGATAPVHAVQADCESQYGPFPSWLMSLQQKAPWCKYSMAILATYRQSRMTVALNQLLCCTPCTPCAKLVHLYILHLDPEAGYVVNMHLINADSCTESMPIKLTQACLHVPRDSLIQPNIT